MKQKIMAIALAITLTASVIMPAAEVKAESAQGQASENSSMENAVEMQLEEEYHAELAEGEYAWYKFTPEEDGIYILSSSGTSDTYGELYSAENKDEKITFDDDGDGSNFYIRYYLENGRTYYLKASGYGGDAATFSVNVKKTEVQSLEIFYNRNVPVTYGESAALKVTAAVPQGEQVTYQWYKSSSMEKIEGAISASYTLPENNVESDYYCEVTCGNESETAYFFVNINTGLTVSTDEDNTVMVELGTTTTLEVTAAGGAGALTYQWYDGDAEEDFIISGATGNTYELLVDKNISRSYSCKVTDGIVSKVVSFWLDTGLRAYSSTGTDEEGEEGSSSDRNVSVPYGGSTTLEVTATGSTGELQYTWYKYVISEEDEEEVPQIIEGASGSTYEASGDGSYRGDYYCSVTDGISTRSVYFHITLDTGLTAVSDTGTDYSNEEGSSSSRNVMAKYGEKTTLSVTASGGAGALSYQWYNGLKPSPSYLIAGATASSYELPEGDNTSRYCCRVTDGIITKNVIFRVTLDSGIVITNATGDTSYQSGATIYKNISVNYGENLTLTVTATGGIGDLSYEWYDVDDEDIIPEATGNSYTITGNNSISACYCIVRDSISFKEVYFEITVNTGFSASSKSGQPYGNNPDCQRIIKTNSGDTVTLSIEAFSQVGNLTYNWVRTDVSPNQEIACNGNSYSVKAEDKTAIYDCNVSDGADTKSLRFVVLPDIDFHWNKTSETLTISGTGSIPYDIFLYSGCNAGDRECMNRLNSLKVIIEDGVTGIDNNALTIERKSNLNYPCDITIPASVKSIGEKAVGYESYSYTDIDSEPYFRKSATCTIHGYKDTAAQKYAADNGIAFKLLTETSVVNLNDCSINITPQSMTYTGRALKPKVTVKNGTNTLKEGTDYSLSYSNNTNIGTALVTITGKNNYTGKITKPFSITVTKGSAYTIGAYKYKITNGSEVSFAGLKNKKTAKVSVPNTVNIGGKNFKVTSIDAKALRKTSVASVTIGNNVKTIGNSAFEGCSKLTKATIGTGVTKIGTSTFKNCKKLGNITIKSAKLKTVGKNAFKGIKSNAKIKVPAKKLKDYKKLLKGKGQGKKVRITK